jgi:hypothetical protein
LFPQCNVVLLLVPQQAFHASRVVACAIIAVVEQADADADGFEEPPRQTVARVMQDRLVQRHVPLERVWLQAVNLQHVVDLAAGSGYAIIDLPEPTGRLAGCNDFDVGHEVGLFCSWLAPS